MWCIAALRSVVSFKIRHQHGKLGSRLLTCKRRYKAEHSYLLGGGAAVKAFTGALRGTPVTITGLKLGGLTMAR